MPRLRVYSQPIQRYYTANLFSLAMCYRVMSFVLLAILPFFIAYRIPGFWVKESSYREQPKVSFQHQLLVSLSGPPGVLLTWSTLSNYNRLAGERLRVPVVTSHETDSNRDGLRDSLNISVRVPLADDESVHQIDLLLLFYSRLRRYAHLHVQGMALIQHSAPLAGRRLFVDGDLIIRQRYPLPWTGVVTSSNLSVIDSSSIFADSYQLDSIIQQYKSRNETTVLKDSTKVWQGPRAPGQPFLIDAFIRYPEQTFVYRPGFWQLMKFAWIQYLAVLVIVRSVFLRVTEFVFENRLFSTAKTNTS